MKMHSFGVRLSLFMLLGAVLSFMGTALSVGRSAALVAISDGLLLSGVAIISVYLLSFVSSRGGFDIFSYSFRAIGSALTGAPVSDYHSYKAEKSRRSPSRELLFSGLIYLLLALALALASMLAL